MATTVDALRRVLGDTFLMYTHSHISHWNVMGSGFPQYHSFLDGLYNDLFEAIDAVAEHIRAKSEFAPLSLTDLTRASAILDSQVPVSWDGIRARLYAENETLLEGLREACVEAARENDQGLLNFLADRCDRHAKWAWMLRSSL